MDLLYRIVRRLLRDREVSFSRNRNFDAYEDTMVQRAARIARHLESVERDLLAIGDGGATLRALEEEDGEVRVHLHVQGGKMRRMSVLRPEEWALLLERDELADILSRLARTLSKEEQRAWLARVPDLSALEPA